MTWLLLIINLGYQFMIMWCKHEEDRLSSSLFNMFLKVVLQTIWPLSLPNPLCNKECCNPSLGLTTKAKACKGAGQEECGRVWEWRLTLPSEFPFWELESRWTPKLSKSDCRGQNTSHWRVLYIIGNLLKCRCLKWACMTHLDICNTSYGKKKGWESNW
jgi:hypothetical protein